MTSQFVKKRITEIGEPPAATLRQFRAFALTFPSGGTPIGDLPTRNVLFLILLCARKFPLTIKYLRHIYEKDEEVSSNKEIQFSRASSGVIPSKSPTTQTIALLTRLRFFK